jgi:hypothetical protein
MTKNHNCSGLHFIGARHIEVFGAVSVGQADIAGHYDVTFKKARKTTGGVMAGYARRRRLLAYAPDTVELFAFAYDTSIGPAVSKHSLKSVTLADDPSSSCSNNAIA